MADPAYLADLPEDLRAEPMFKDIPDVATLAKVARDSKHALGGAIRPPGPDAGADARKDFIAKLQKHAPELILVPDGDDDAAKAARDAAWAKLGKPSDAKEYALPKDVEIPEEHLEALRKEAAEEGLTKSQFQARAKRAADALGAATRAETEARAALKKELGVAFDDRIGAAAAAAEKLGFPEALVRALRNGTVDLPTYKALEKVAKGFGETRQVATQTNGGDGKLTPAEHRQRALEVRQRIVKEGRQLSPAQYQDLLEKLVEHEAGSGEG